MISLPDEPISLALCGDVMTGRGVAEEAPGAYKDAGVVVEAAEHAGLARRVARLVPVICVKG